MAALTMMDVLMTTLRGATDTEMLAFMQLLNDRGIPLFYAGEEARTPKKEPKAKAEPKVAMPVAMDGAAPDASEYRIAEADVDHTTCVGRLIQDSCADKRWSKTVYREMQCGKKIAEDSDLCKICAKREEKYEGKPGPWRGRVTEEPLSWLHMLGTAWAEGAKPTFNASAPAPSPVPSSAPSPVPAAEKEAKKAAAEAKKEAKKAEKEAKKVEKEAKKAAAEKEKEAKKVEKEAKKVEKEAKKVEKEAKKAEKPKAKAE